MHSCTGKLLITTILLAAFLLWPGPPASGIMRTDLDVAWLTANSPDIVVGEIVELRCEWRSDIPSMEEMIVTVVTLRVKEAVKGELQPDALTEFTVLGGELGTQVITAEDMPENLAVGDRGVFFLRDWQGLRVPAAWDFGCARFLDREGTRLRTLGQEMDTSRLLSEVRAIEGAGQ